MALSQRRKPRVKRDFGSVISNQRLAARRNDRRDAARESLFARRDESRATHQSSRRRRTPRAARQLRTRLPHASSGSRFARPQGARPAELETRKATIQVARPVHGDSTLPKFVTKNVVLCEETNPPEGEDPISWMLAATLPIDTNFMGWLATLLRPVQRLERFWSRIKKNFLSVTYVV